MFSKDKPTTRDTKISFLTKHFRYHTMSSWNRSTSYANNVKIHNLAVDADIKNKMYELLSSEHEELDEQIQSLIEDFEEETGYAAGFNGRSDGYIVLYDTQYDTERERRHVMPGRSIDQCEDFEDWKIKDVNDRITLVCRFDKLCDDIIKTVIEYCSTHHMCHKTIQIQQTVAVFIENGASDTDDEDMDKLMPDGFIDNANAENDEDKMLSEYNAVGRS